MPQFTDFCILTAPLILNSLWFT